MHRKLILAAAAALMFSTSFALADDPLFHDLGGRDGIATIVDDATVNFLADPRIKATFDNTNMDLFKGNLTDQLCVVAGGPCEYKGQSMHDAHKGLHLTNADFNALVEDLQAGMDKAGVPFATQNRLLARLAPMQHDVVTK
ncbi:MAG: group 1 truncated hemoglobin [Rhizomicrobium sp.]|jgi:hemoglobin